MAVLNPDLSTPYFENHIAIAYTAHVLGHMGGKTMLFYQSQRGFHIPVSDLGRRIFIMRMGKHIAAAKHFNLIFLVRRTDLIYFFNSKATASSA